MKRNDRSIYKDPMKGWADKCNSATRPAKYYDTQKEAYEAARNHLQNQKGGEITIMRGDDGRIREKNTIAPGNDPYPPKG